MECAFLARYKSTSNLLLHIACVLRLAAARVAEEKLHSISTMLVRHEKERKHVFTM